MPLRRCCRSLQVFIAIADEHPEITAPSVDWHYRLCFNTHRPKSGCDRQYKMQHIETWKRRGKKRLIERASEPSVRLFVSAADSSAALSLFLGS